MILPRLVVISGIRAEGGHETGKVVAGARAADGKSLLDIRKYLRSGAFDRSPPPRAGENTTIAVVATNARLTKDQATQLKALPAGSKARQTFLWKLAVDPDVQKHQAIAERRAR